MPQPTVKSCGVLLVAGEPVTSFLLMQHVDRWDLPKGHVDEGETELECALRELEEETGIQRSEIVLDPEFRFEQHYVVTSTRHGEQGRLKALVIFLARAPKELRVDVTEHEGHKWFPWSPPHRIQQRTIDPVLAAVELHLQSKGFNT